MRTMELTVNVFVTMDGVMQGPGGDDEDPSDGFDRGGWLPPFVDEVFGEVVDGWFSHAEEILLGRTTYELLYPYWSQVTDPSNPEYSTTSQKHNDCPKHVASRTLRSTEWKNSSVITGDVVEAVTALKAKPGGELQVHGSAGLIQTLNRHRLVDEYRMLVFPVVLGTGKRLFGDGSAPTGFKTVENRTTSTGVLALRLRTTGEAPQGHI
jgi:dihydrofolate reductase